MMLRAEPDHNVGAERERVVCLSRLGSTTPAPKPFDIAAIDEMPGPSSRQASKMLVLWELCVLRAAAVEVVVVASTTVALSFAILGLSAT